jgi:hypothetical protein
MFLKLEHYDLAIGEVSHHKRTFFNKLTKRSHGWIQEEIQKN